MDNMKLQFVRAYPEEQRMDVALHDEHTGSDRVVAYTWALKNAEPVPPEGWWSSVVGEVNFQRSQELKRATGRDVPQG